MSLIKRIVLNGGIIYPIIGSNRKYHRGIHGAIGLLSLSLFSKKDKDEDRVDLNLMMTTPITDVNQLKDGSTKSRFELMCLKLQYDYCKAMERLEEKHVTLGISGTSEKPAKFRTDRWERKEGGGGITCIMEDGEVFERAGVNISVVHGSLGGAAVAQMRSRGRKLVNPPGKDGLPFMAIGISSVVHPRNPHVPTMHFNFRIFQVIEWDESTQKEKMTWWFGGGADLTPYIYHEEDAIQFHRALAEGCSVRSGSYDEYKKWCDDYFHNVHRGERRGVGGIFFDDLDSPDEETALHFMRSCMNSIMKAYVPTIEKHANTGYSLEDREWQLIRRGRYVEFNLVYDRGTKFGLYTPGARFESILMSLPRSAKWSYCHEPTSPNQKELMHLLKNPKDKWL